MFASPVAYSVSLVPQDLRTLYALNPMVGVIEGFRWGLLGGEHSSFAWLPVSAAVVAGLLITGLIFFKRMEATFADVV
jgi:lipopolysaccharide transport system permease protein